MILWIRVLFRMKPSPLRLAMLCWAVFWTGQLVRTAWAHPSEQYPADARAQGMGRAFTAIATGPTAVYWNPAALAAPQPNSFSGFSRAELLPDLQRSPHYNAFALTLQRQSVGFGIALSTITEGSREGAALPEDRTLRLGMGVNLARDLAPRRTRMVFSLGFSYKRMEETSGYVYAGSCDGTPGGGDIDVGMLFAYRLTGMRFVAERGQDRGGFLGIRTGAVLRNLFKQTIKCRETVSERPLDRALHAGGAIEFGMGPTRHLGHTVKGVISAERQSVFERREYTGWQYRRDINTYHYGAEISLLGVLSARGGWVDDKESGIEDWSWGGGLGIDLWDAVGSLDRIGARLDYASVADAPDQERPTHWTFSVWLVP